MSHTMTLDKQMITNVAIGVGAATALYALYSFMDSTLTKRHEKLDEAEDEKNGAGAQIRRFASSKHGDTATAIRSLGHEAVNNIMTKMHEFASSCDAKDQPELNIDDFCKMMSFAIPHMEEDMLHLMFQCADTDKNAKLSYTEVLCLVNTLANDEDRKQMLFQLYAGTDGVLQADELRQMLSSKAGLAVNAPSVSALVDQIYSNLGRSQTEPLTFAEFKTQSAMTQVNVQMDALLKPANLSHEDVRLAYTNSKANKK